MNACSCVRTCRQNLPSFVRALASEEPTTSSENMVTPFFMKMNPPKSLKLAKGHSKDSAQDLPRTVRNKPHSALANQVLVTKSPLMLPVQHTSEPSLQPNHAQQHPDSCQNNFCQRDWTPKLRQPPLPSSAPLTTLRTPQPGSPAKSSPSSRRGECRDIRAKPPQVKQSGLTSLHDSEPTFAPLRRGRLSAPQFQAQLSRLNPTTTFEKHSAHQRSVTARDKDRGFMCRTHVSHKWRHH